MKRSLVIEAAAVGGVILPALAKGKGNCYLKPSAAA